MTLHSDTLYLLWANQFCIYSLMPHAQHRSMQCQLYSLWDQTLDEQANNNTTETVYNYNVLFFLLPLCFLSFDLPILINPFGIFKLSLADF
jgi:hypothetical protein